MPETDFTIAFGNPNSNETVTYSGSVKGRIYEANDSLEGNDGIKGGWQFHGELGGGWDEYKVRGYLTDLTLNGGMQLTIDGENYSDTEALNYRPDRFKDSDSSDNNGGSSSDDNDGNSYSYDNRFEAPVVGGAEGYQVGEDNAKLWQAPNARNRDVVPAHTTRPVDLYMAPDGDDDAEGTRDDPIQSLHEVARRVPFCLLHYFVVHAAPGRYENPEGGGMALGPIVQGLFTARGGRQGFEIQGEGNGPEETVFEGYPQFNVNFHACGSADNAAFKNCTLQGTFQAYQGAGFGLRDCIINPMGQAGHGYDSYGGSVWLNNVHFGDNTKWAINLPEGGEVMLDGCSGAPSEGVVKGKRGTVRSGYGNDFSAPGGSWAAKVNSNLPVDVIRGKREQ